MATDEPTSYNRGGSQFANSLASILNSTENEFTRSTSIKDDRKSHRNRDKKKFRFGSSSDGHTVVVKESFIDELHVWPASILLAEYLYSKPSLVLNHIVLELGTGCGLPSLLCCKLGATKVYGSDATKFPNILKSLTEMASYNGVSAQFQSVGLTWGRFTKETIKLQPEIVIAADIFYEEEDYEDILMNVEFYFRKGCTAFYTVIHQRGTTKRIAGLLAKLKMRVKEIEVTNLILSSNHLSLDNTDKLMLVEITPYQVVKKPQIKTRLSLDTKQEVVQRPQVKSRLSVDGNDASPTKDTVTLNLIE